MIKWLGPFFGGGLVLAAIVGPVVAQPSASTVAVPHRAMYELRLDRAADQSQILDVRGEMGVSWEVSCEGWVIDQTYRLDFVYADGADLELIASYDAWESRDGQRFSFSSRTSFDNLVQEELRGEAEMATEGGVAHYRLPDDMRQALPSGTYFPSHHTIELLRRADNGDRAFSAYLFDGTRAEGLTEVNAAIGRMIPPEPDSGDGPAILAGRESWPVRLAFFDADQAGPQPDHEVGFRLYGGGIVDRLIINYGDFSVRGRIAAFEALSLPDDC